MFLELLQIQNSCLCYREQADAVGPTNRFYQDFIKVVVRKKKKKENKGPTGTLQGDEIRKFLLNGRALHSCLALKR